MNTCVSRLLWLRWNCIERFFNTSFREERGPALGGRDSLELTRIFSSPCASVITYIQIHRPDKTVYNHCRWRPSYGVCCCKHRFVHKRAAVFTGKHWSPTKHWSSPYHTSLMRSFDLKWVSAKCRGRHFYILNILYFKPVEPDSMRLILKKSSKSIRPTFDHLTLLL